MLHVKCKFAEKLALSYLNILNAKEFSFNFIRYKYINKTYILQSLRKTERQEGKERETHRDRERHKEKGGQTDRQTDGRTNRRTG